MTIMKSLIKPLSQLRHAVISSVNLMVPKPNTCTVCGHAMFSNGSSRGNAASKATLLHVALCGKCLSAIPWLIRILCLRCGRGVHCDDCKRRKDRPFVSNRSAVTYNPAMREWLALYKYRGNERLAPILADMLVPVLERLTAEVLAQSNDAAMHKNSFAEKRKMSWKQRLSKLTAPSRQAACWDAITYVPISRERAQERGFNQAEQIAAYLSDAFRIPMYSLLVRDRHTDKMSFKTRSERLQNAQMLFTLHMEQMKEFIREDNRQSESIDRTSTRNQRKDRPLRILLVDDIYTTGSTVEACSKALKQYGERSLSIYVLTWARS